MQQLAETDNHGHTCYNFEGNLAPDKILVAWTLELTEAATRCVL